LEAKAAFAQFERQYGDLQLAMQWFIDRGRVDEAFRLATALTSFWMATKRLDEGLVWYSRVLTLPGGNDAYRGRVLFDAGYLAFWQGDDERSTLFQNQALELGRRANDPTVTALALVGLARIALRTTGADEARRLCRQALAVTEGTADRLGRSSAMHVLGVAAQMAGDLDEARELMSRRIALGREQGNLVIVYSEAANLSAVERQLGNLDQAEALAREALEIVYRRGDALAIPWVVNGLAAVAKDRGQFELAATLIGIADAMMEAAGGDWPPDEWEHYQQTVAALIEALEPAVLERARAAGRAMTPAEAVDFALDTHLVN
jgi:non-specific serine/threonine protein kinase